MPDGLDRISRKKEKYRRRQVEVFNAAAAVFAEKGYHGASTGDIATKLGIAQSSLYYYFKSKDEALEMVCLEGTKGYVERLKVIVESSLTPAQKIRGAILSHIQPIDTIPDYFRTFTEELRYLPRSRRKMLNQMISDYNKLMERILADGVANKTFKTSLDCHLAMLQLISQCNEAPQWISSKTGYNLEEIATSIADNFLLGATRR
ncbi:MAG: TetR/AcrR family transcriptional regulator [Rhodospirillaceae bacterium]|jgi:AcrR family transcriptional regulator|nr:TetR/AcrR family transcriptional regulator [Rhodospirillaceae bacterium]MBT4589542.1 TetR/AcrR family transcriptional regulator [Rhodospirillaceae bacterium]MBT4939041.1 TetR/AcrR family transcriptional regulator [Rhodospirillaceae bacterium]MBT5938436.1 TetR/AcrR family transcriptional regulator [Rhodospirillaceae bacterium]MBT7268456.1 TetR/AcrR family transcriptional regulator [Rhodospirillaceae bacterium]